MRIAAVILFRTIVRVPILAKLYLGILPLLVRFVSEFWRPRILNAMKQVSWPQAVLKSTRVRVGKSTWVRLQPHSGEFDFEAVLGGRLEYEKEVFAILDQRLPRYDSIIEIGANVGLFTLYFAKHLVDDMSKTLYVFEPSPEAFDRLRYNLRINDLNQVYAFNAAVGSTSGFASFSEPDAHLTNGSLVASFARQFSDTVKSRSVLVVAADQLTELIAPNARVLIKIDVEGFEADLLVAMQPLLESHKPDLLIEVLPDYVEAISAVPALGKLGYLNYEIDSNGLHLREKLSSGFCRDWLLSVDPE